VKGEPEYLPLIAKPGAYAQTNRKSVAADTHGDKGRFDKPQKSSSRMTDSCTTQKKDRISIEHPSMIHVAKRRKAPDAQGLPVVLDLRLEAFKTEFPGSKGPIREKDMSGSDTLFTPAASTFSLRYCPLYV
jgi:hypothetical protein